MLQRAHLIFSLLLVLGLWVGASAQTAAEGVSISLSSPRTMFDQKHDAKIEIRVTNRLRVPLSLAGLWFPVNISLRKPRNYSECRFADCFGATFRLTGSRRIDPGESLEFRVDLADLHWYDMILSGRSLREPDNFFTEVPRGNYELSAAIAVPRKNDVPETVSSNGVFVTVNTAAKPD